MKHKIFTIHDSAAGAYLPPFFLPTDAMAIRTFGDCINDSKHAFSLHPDNYTLFDLGHWLDGSASISPHNAPISLGNGIDFVKYDQPDEQQLPLLEEVKK